jgi:hypothetical protein
MSSRTDAEFLADIKEAIRRINMYIENMRIIGRAKRGPTSAYRRRPGLARF